jgi:DNA repair protein RadA/Sms
MGRCPNCGEWNTMVEELASDQPSAKRSGASTRSEPRRLSEIEGDPWERIPLPVEEFSRVLGGGLVPGSLILMAGDPGIGKSTMLLGITALMADYAGPALYVSGEESAGQIKMRADRMGVTTDNLFQLTTMLSILHRGMSARCASVPGPSSNLPKIPESRFSWLAM